MTYFITGSLYLLIPFPYLIHCPISSNLTPLVTTSIIPFRFIMLSEMARFIPSLWLSNIPVYVCARAHAHYSFSISLSTNGHLGCFHILAVVNSAAVSVGVRIYLQISVFIFSDRYLEVKLRDYMVVLFLIF
uniref:Uncharacterized protein n=1 Tax=Molossus molossus TaxID=27622 RepID=A0A7J8HHB1_MOLMO|nr:hypothetical protein HJG59_011052 [Molossus molossus]